jgi:hypothetical protein
MVWRNSSSIGCAVGHCPDNVAWPGRFVCCKYTSSYGVRVMMANGWQTTPSSATTSLPASSKNKSGARCVVTRLSAKSRRARTSTSIGRVARQPSLRADGWMIGHCFLKADLHTNLHHPSWSQGVIWRFTHHLSSGLPFLAPTFPLSEFGIAVVLHFIHVCLLCMSGVLVGLLGLSRRRRL